MVVFDLGGGTLDVSVLQVATFSGSINVGLSIVSAHQRAYPQVLSTSGDQQLGGQDFDRVLAKLINQKCKRQNPDHPEQYRRDLVVYLNSLSNAVTRM